MGRVSKYSEEFRRQAAMLVVDARRPVRDVARDLGVNHETLRNWVAALRRERAAPGGPVGVDERAELARLRRRVAELELEKEILKNRGLLRPGDGAVSQGVVFGFIAAEKTRYGVRRLRRVLGVSETAFYDCEAAAGARTAWVEHPRVYGARRLTAELHDRGQAWNRKEDRPAHARRRDRGYPPPPARQVRPPRDLTVTAAAPVERNFTAPAPNRRGVADFVPRGAVDSSGGERPSPPGRRSGPGWS